MEQYFISYESGVTYGSFSSLHAAKIAATKALCYGCGDVTIYQGPEIGPNSIAICQRVFSQSGNYFKWSKWEYIN